MALFAVLFAVVAAESCAHSRADGYECISRYGDLDGDGLLTRDEIDVLRARSLHYYERALGWIAGETTDTVMLHCDYDGDGVISASDFYASTKTCLRDCNAVESLFEYIFDRLATRAM